MSSGTQGSNRSPSNSLTDSYRELNVPRSQANTYERRTTIPEEDENEYQAPSYNGDESVPEAPPVPTAPRPNDDPYISALKHRFAGRSNNDYSYRKPIAPATAIPAPPPAPAPSSVAPQVTPSEPPREPYASTRRPYTGSSNGSADADGKTFKIPPLRPVGRPDQPSPYRKTNLNEGTSTTQPPPLAPTVPNRTVEPSAVPTVNRSVSFLGESTFSEFERCFQECLERERMRTGVSSVITREDYPSTSGLHIPTTVDPYLLDYTSRLSPMLQLDDIRQINVALSRSGIPLFPYQRFYPHIHSSLPVFTTAPDSYYTSSHFNPPTAHGVVSACRLVEEDSPMGYHSNGPQAVENVWKALQQHQLPPLTTPTRSTVSFRDPY